MPAVRAGGLLAQPRVDAVGAERMSARQFAKNTATGAEADAAHVLLEHGQPGTYAINFPLLHEKYGIARAPPCVRGAPRPRPVIFSMEEVEEWLWKVRYMHTHRFAWSVHCWGGVTGESWWYVQ